MRIIAGTHRSRRLKSLPGVHTRPTLDHIKEACFARLGPLIESAQVLDLFAGSGSIGLEALSRGAQHAVFVEASAPAFKVLKENVHALEFHPQATLLKMEAFHALRHLSALGKRFDVIYLDPPYQKIDQTKLMNALKPLTHADTHIVHEGLAADAVLEFDGFTLQNSARYGRIRLDTYRRTP
jgi:16S rRNA (guanine966-N2)-methyltransferase